MTATGSPRWLVFGATGRTGQRLVAAAHARGVRVAAFVRDAARAPTGAAEVHVGDVRDPEAVRSAVRAGDVIVSTLGGGGGEGGSVVGDGGRAITAAAMAQGASRLLGVVGAGVLQLDATRQRNQAEDYPAALRAVGAEHEAMHRSFASSGLWWALVCTPRLLDGEPTGRMRRERDYLPDGTGAVTTGDVALLVLELATDPAARPGRVGVNGTREDTTLP
jgi:putative NADH-flavin reductase